MERSATPSRAPAAATKTALAVLLSLLTAPPRVGAYTWPDSLSSDDLRGASVLFGRCRTVTFPPDEYACRDCDVMCGGGTWRRRTEDYGTVDCELVCGQCDSLTGSRSQFPRKDYVEFNVCNNDDLWGQPVYDPFGSAREKDANPFEKCEGECKESVCNPKFIEEIMNEEEPMELLQEIMPLSASSFNNSNMDYDDLDWVLDTCLEDCFISLCVGTETSGAELISEEDANPFEKCEGECEEFVCNPEILEEIMKEEEPMELLQEIMPLSASFFNNSNMDYDDLDLVRDTCLKECFSSLCVDTETSRAESISAEVGSSSFRSIPRGCQNRILPLEEYLEGKIEFLSRQQDMMCNECHNWCPDDGGDGGDNDKEFDCDQCVDECEKIKNMEENGYIDATEFIECQMIFDDGNQQLFAGPICSDYGKIKIGVFLDEWCTRPDLNKDVEDYLQDGDGYQMKLSHALLKHTYESWQAFPCSDDGEEGRRLEEGDEGWCYNLYHDSAPFPLYAYAQSRPFHRREDASKSIMVMRANQEVEAFDSNGEELSVYLWETNLTWEAPLPGRLLDQDEWEWTIDEEEHKEWTEKQNERENSLILNLRFAEHPSSEWGWMLQSSSLVRAYSGTKVGEWIAPLDDLGSVIMRPDNGTLFHCEYMEFNFDDPDGSEFGMVAMRDVIIGTANTSFYGSPVCGSRIFNPCDGEVDEKMCQFIGGNIECIEVETDEGLVSPVPGLSRREYLDAFMCGEYTGWYLEDEHDKHDDYYEREPKPGWINKTNPEWSDYHIRPTQCVEKNDTELILFSLHQHHCSDYLVGEYVAPLSVLLNLFNPILENYGDEMHLECTESPDEVGRWLRVGCSEFSADMLYVNSYSDPLCTEDKLAVEPFRFSSVLNYCQSCEPNPYPFADDEAAAHQEKNDLVEVEEHDEDEFWEENHDDGNWEEEEAFFLECSVLQPYIQQECDQNCQDTILRRDLRWDGLNAFLQANNVTAFPLDYGFLWDDTDCSDCIDSGTQGEMISRAVQKNANGDEVSITMSFAPNKSTPGNSEAEDVVLSGWVMNNTHISDGTYHFEGNFYAGRSMISVPPGKQLFHCEYMEFNYKAGTFVGYDVVIGAYLPEGYDVCSLSVYNPCREDVGQGSTCYAVDGGVRCLDAGNGNKSVAVAMHSGASSVLPICRDGAQDTPASDSPEPTISPVSQFDGSVAGVIAPTAAPSVSALPTPEFSGGSQASWVFESSAILKSVCLLGLFW